MSLTGKTVLVATEGLADDVAEQISVACERLGADVQLLTTVPRAHSRVKKPVLVVAGLPSGDRQVPREISRVLRSYYADTPLLLLCSEPLIRPMVSRYGGLLTLLGPPFSEAQILSRIRMLLAERPTNDGPTSRREVEGTSIGEHRLATHWVGEIRQKTSPETLFTGDASPAGLLAMVPFGPNAPHLEHVEQLDDVFSKEVGEAAVAELLGDDVGLVHLARHTGDWLVYWPAKTPLTLFCDARLPARYDFTTGLAKTGDRMRRLRAASGDVLLATADALGEEALAAAQAAASKRGGVGVLEELEARVANGRGIQHAVVIEVL